MRDWNGAVERIRTFDRLVNSQPLYRAEPRRRNKLLPHSQFKEYYLSLVIHPSEEHQTLSA
jgi:hypothetical protein